MIYIIFILPDFKFLCTENCKTESMKKLIIGILSIGFLWGCKPGGPEYVEDIDVVYTTFDNEFDFAGKNTYAMPDNIVVDIEIENGDTTYVFMTDIFATPILNAIDAEMSSYGWQKVDPATTQPDVVITPAAIKSTTVYYSYWYDWWYGGWGGWYGGGWGWYYPPYYSVSSYTTGTLILTMASPEPDNSPIRESQAVWIMAGNGLFTGVYDVGRVTKAIDQGFAQSPYLKTN